MKKIKEILAKGKFIQLCRENHWEWVERVNCSGVVVIVALNSERRLLLVEQYRMSVKKNVIELPAGLVGDQDKQESFETAATRELLEETGYSAGHWEFLAKGPASPGLTPEEINIYRAHDLHRVGEAKGDGHEEITCHEVPINQVHLWLKNQEKSGKVVDPKVYIGLYFMTKRTN